MPRADCLQIPSPRGVKQQYSRQAVLSHLWARDRDKEVQALQFQLQKNCFNPRSFPGGQNKSLEVGVWGRGREWTRALGAQGKTQDTSDWRSDRPGWQCSLGFLTLGKLLAFLTFRIPSAKPDSSSALLRVTMELECW